MILAAIEGQLLIVLLMALFGFISWLSGKLNPGEKKAPPEAPRAPSSAPPRRAGADSEEERMRRFLEALGLPTDQPPVTPPMRSRPIPPVTAAPPPLIVPPRPRPVPKLPPPVPQRSLDELATPALPVEKIVLPELVTTSVAEFQTVTSKISATPQMVPVVIEPTVPRVSIHELLRATLASPQQLRSAFVLREILGPPPGLRGS